ncbi:hypothetical protein [Flavobacterium sp. J27]|uniref:hypothetical protein n=1 Tax=Flavobacterium sp. J27 TaxID=2060419 RepID=UPI0013EE6ED8|nr:hypothetical protein [Flavobacterium sp. J27]
MRVVYLFIAVVLFLVSFTSCTTEDISDSIKTSEYADDDTGGQNGQINPPPPPLPTIP